MAHLLAILKDTRFSLGRSVLLSLSKRWEEEQPTIKQGILEDTLRQTPLGLERNGQPRLWGQLLSELQQHVTVYPNKVHYSSHTAEIVEGVGHLPTEREAATSEGPGPVSLQAVLSCTFFVLPLLV